MKKTNLSKAKEIALAFLYLEPKPVPEIPFLLYHPYLENTMTFGPDNKLLDLTKYDDFIIVRNIYEERIKNTETVYQLFALMRTSYHFSFLKYIKQYLSKQDFDKLLAEIWISSENPNQDENVSINQFITWFSKADKSTIMSNKELRYYNNLPDIVNIYRGVAVGRAKQKGLSWTDDIKTAKWFAGRFDNDKKKGYVLSAKINKEDIFAYFNSRNENELLCNSKKIYDIQKIPNS